MKQVNLIYICSLEKRQFVHHLSLWNLQWESIQSTQFNNEGIFILLLNLHSMQTLRKRQSNEHNGAQIWQFKNSKLLKFQQVHSSALTACTSRYIYQKKNRDYAELCHRATAMQGCKWPNTLFKIKKTESRCAKAAQVHSWAREAEGIPRRISPVSTGFISRTVSNLQCPCSKTTLMRKQQQRANYLSTVIHLDEISVRTIINLINHVITPWITWCILSSISEGAVRLTSLYYW